MQNGVCYTGTITEAKISKIYEPESIGFSFKILNKFTNKCYKSGMYVYSIINLCNDIMIKGIYGYF